MRRLTATIAAAPLVLGGVGLASGAAASGASPDARATQTSEQAGASLLLPYIEQENLYTTMF